MDFVQGMTGWVMNSKPVGSRMTRSISFFVQRKTGLTFGRDGPEGLRDRNARVQVPAGAATGEKDRYGFGHLRRNLSAGKGVGYVAQGRSR